MGRSSELKIQSQAASRMSVDARTARSEGKARERESGTLNNEHDFFWTRTVLMR
jgi:hypothetical protein